MVEPVLTTTHVETPIAIKARHPGPKEQFVYKTDPSSTMATSVHTGLNLFQSPPKTVSVTHYTCTPQVCTHSVLSL